ncbi:MAG: carcinine hydrolase/isopenicillin-N N-acyltransferase family protein [Candidatus Hermodarchaeota archaeon]
MGCTTGAKILNNGHIVIIFKNKDFKTPDHSDTISLEHTHAFGVRGVDLGTQKVAGFSIGVNQYGLAVVNSNVLSTSDPPYDILTERIVLEARTIEEAIKICKKEIQGAQNYQWCNMVIATPKQLAGIELKSSDLAIAQSSDYVVRTNHHLILRSTEEILSSDQNKGPRDIKNSEIRYKNAEKMLKNASSVNEIFSLLKFHQEEASICRHGQNTVIDVGYTTVYSYVLTIHMEKHPQIYFDVVKGPPCINSVARFKLEFPLNDDTKVHISQRYPA